MVRSPSPMVQYSSVAHAASAMVPDHTGSNPAGGTSSPRSIQARARRAISSASNRGSVSGVASVASMWVREPSSQVAETPYSLAVT